MEASNNIGEYRLFKEFIVPKTSNEINLALQHVVRNNRQCSYHAPSKVHRALEPCNSSNCVICSQRGIPVWLHKVIKGLLCGVIQE